MVTNVQLRAEACEAAHYETPVFHSHSSTRQAPQNRQAVTDIGFELFNSLTLFRPSKRLLKHSNNELATRKRLVKLRMCVWQL
jgi:hypothetical protein